jgi:hypothetical protein
MKAGFIGLSEKLMAQENEMSEAALRDREGGCPDRLALPPGWYARVYPGFEDQVA